MNAANNGRAKNDRAKSSRTAAGIDREREARLEAFCVSLLEAGLDGALLSRREDYFYYTGYTGSDSVLVVSARRRKAVLITDPRYREEAELTAAGCEVAIWNNGFGVFTGKTLARLRLGKIGYTPAALTVSFFEAVKEGAGRARGWTDAAPLISRQRAVKSRSEIMAMRVALECAEAAFEAAKCRWRVGMTEQEVRNDLEWEMRRRGASDASFETIVAVGSQASLPHAHAGGRKVAPGKMLLIDWGAVVNRYCSDSTRTLWPGEIPKIWRKRYAAVLAAGRAGLELVRAGVQGKEAHAAAMESFRSVGMDRYFTHGLGHGVGLAVHEEPRLSPAGLVLSAGNIVTVEPGVYYSGSGGIRVEDMVLVTDGAPVVLNRLPRSEESAVF